MEEISAHGGALRKQAQALLREGKLEEAEQKCREEIAFYRPLGGLAVNELLGDIQLAQGKYQEALDTYAILRRSGWSTTLHINIALCYLRLGDLDKAKEAYIDEIQTERGLRPEHMPGTEDLKSMELTLMLALAGVHSGESAEALKYLLAAEKLAPDDWAIADTIGQRLDYMARYEDAIPYYRRAIKLGGDKVSYEHRMRVEMHERRNAPPAPKLPATEQSGAAQMAAQVKKLQAQAVAAYGGDGISPAARKMMASLKAPYQEAKQRARALFNQGKYKEAEAQCMEAWGMAPVANGGLPSQGKLPFYGEELPLMGDIMLAQGRNIDALSWYLRPSNPAQPADTTQPRSNLNAALAYCRLGDFQKAKRFAPDAAIAEKAAPGQWDQWPGTGDIRSLEASLLLARGLDEASAARRQEALFFLEQAQKLAPRNQLIADAVARQSTSAQ